MSELDKAIPIVIYVHPHIAKAAGGVDFDVSELSKDFTLSVNSQWSKMLYLKNMRDDVDKFLHEIELT